MRRARKTANPYKLAVVAFFIICIPIWLIKGHANSKSDITIPYEQEVSVEISIFNTTSQKLIKMDIEEYLVGVIAAEMPASFSAEALKAQAVAARTYTAKKLAKFGGSGCTAHDGDICTDSTHCQAYSDAQKRKKNWKDDAVNYEKKIREAITQTHGEIIVYNDQPIEAFFHSTAGGKTENSENAFSAALPYLVSVESDEVNAPKYQSKVTISRKEFIKVLNKELPGANLKNATLEKNIKIQSYFESGRANMIKAGNAEITAKSLRTLFSLDSTNIAFAFDKSNVYITTKGYGHGVGMSQTGANAMAAEGAAYDEILLHYYTGTNIKKFW